MAAKVRGASGSPDGDCHTEECVLTSLVFEELLSISLGLL
jgi:hypothetical protein